MSQEQTTAPVGPTSEAALQLEYAILTGVQTWILDRHWCNWKLPISTVSYYGFSSRLQDFGVADWQNSYDRRREAMWVKEA